MTAAVQIKKSVSSGMNNGGDKMGTFIVLVVLAAAVGMAVRKLYKDKKNGIFPQCGKGCGGCAGCTFMRSELEKH